MVWQMAEVRMVKKILHTFAAAALIGTAGIASAPAQTWWPPPVVVDAGSGLMFVDTPRGPTIVAIPLVTTARPVTVGPILRVSGCYWARERVAPGRWLRFRVCG